MAFLRSLGTILTVLFCFSGLEAGQSYFVSPSGDDANAGTGETAAWKTVAKVNGATFAPGDTVAFQRDGVWRESLEPRSSGTADAPLIFTAYGESEPPRFDGSDEVVATGTRIETGGPPYLRDGEDARGLQFAHRGMRELTRGGLLRDT